MDVTDELARLEKRMIELQAETARLTEELERIGQFVARPPRDPSAPLIGMDGADKVPPPAVLSEYNGTSALDSLQPEETDESIR